MKHYVIVRHRTARSHTAVRNINGGKSAPRGQNMGNYGLLIVLCAGRVRKGKWGCGLGVIVLSDVVGSLKCTRVCLLYNIYPEHRLTWFGMPTIWLKQTTSSDLY